MASGVYVIENTVNHRLYVGSSVDIDKRWKEHRRQLASGTHHSRFLQRAWNKYGECEFCFRILMLCEKDELLSNEQSAIDSLRPDYNSAPTAGSQLGYRHTPETRKKLSEAAKRTKNFSGRRHTEETRLRISEAKSGRKFGSYPKDRVRRAADAMRASRSVLSDGDVRFIRALKSAGVPHRDVSILVGCTYWVVADIARNRTFKQVT